jgi:ribosomal protein S18 acetylase RimI-like enzyme
MKRPSARLRPARQRDAAGVAELVSAAYGHYVPRIGRPPSPMCENYAEVIRTRAVTIAEHAGSIVGVVVLAVTGEGFLIENVAVHPAHQGRGIGKALLQFAEVQAQRARFDSIYLYTHEKMTENRALYESIGYVQYERCPSDAPRVYMRKQLGRLRGRSGS